MISCFSLTPPHLNFDSGGISLILFPITHVAISLILFIRLCWIFEILLITHVTFRHGDGFEELTLWIVFSFKGGAQ